MSVVVIANCTVIVIIIVVPLARARTQRKGGQSSTPGSDCLWLAGSSRMAVDHQHRQRPHVRLCLYIVGISFINIIGHDKEGPGPASSFVCAGKQLEEGMMIASPS